MDVFYGGGGEGGGVRRVGRGLVRRPLNRRKSDTGSL